MIRGIVHRTETLQKMHQKWSMALIIFILIVNVENMLAFIFLLQ